MYKRQVQTWYALDAVSVEISEFFRGYGVPTSSPMVLSNQVKPLSFETITEGVATRGVTYTVPSGAVEIAPCRPPLVVARPMIWPPASNVAPPSKLVKQKIPANLL